jgi:hypothetical protein
MVQARLGKIKTRLDLKKKKGGVAHMVEHLLSQYRP